MNLTPPLGYTRRYIQVSTYWTNFGASGSPNAFTETPGLTEWPAYDPVSDIDINLNLTISTLPHLKEKVCDLWDAIAGFSFANP